MKVLYCHCAYANAVPPAVREAVLGGLTRSGEPFEAVADLCELSARKDPRLAQLAQADGPKVIAACFPRAVRWLFHAAGAPLPEAGVTVVNMREATGEAALAAVREAAGLPEGAGAAGTEAGREAVAAQPGNWKPWFPVVDHARCTNCMQCLSFCLFDVFGVDAQKRISVANPDRCKTNCPACSRVCPEVAILFPKYGRGPINGDAVDAQDVEREKMKIDVSALLGGDVYKLLRERHARAASRFSKERDETRALEERKRCLAQLGAGLDVPPEVLMALPSADDILRRAEAAAARAAAARRDAKGEGEAAGGSDAAASGDPPAARPALRAGSGQP